MRIYQLTFVKMHTKMQCLLEDLHRLCACDVRRLLKEIVCLGQTVQQRRWFTRSPYAVAIRVLTAGAEAASAQSCRGRREGMRQTITDAVQAAETAQK